MSMTHSSTTAGRSPQALRSADELTAARNSDRLVKAFSFALFILSTGFFSAVTVISYLDPGYFDRMLISAAKDDIDTMAVGSTEKASPPSDVAAIPIARVVRSMPLRPQDFSIVMVFQDEAHLASPGELWRVKVGSVVPGLGKILAIKPGENGGTVKAERATLKAMPAE